MKPSCNMQIGTYFRSAFWPLNPKEGEKILLPDLAERFLAFPSRSAWPFEAMIAVSNSSTGPSKCSTTTYFLDSIKVASNTHNYIV